MTDLNPCYFCGGHATTRTAVSAVELSAQVICTHCGARGTKMMERPNTNGDFEQDLDALIEQAQTYWQEASEQIDPMRPSHWHEDETWSVEDWQYEISNDDTRLGYADWVRWQKEMSAQESDDASLEDEMSARPGDIDLTIYEDGSFDMEQK
jgi:transcription elongation factor Elf1